MDNKALEQAAREAGIASGFINAHGKQQETAPETRQKLLDAMNFSHRPVAEFSPVPGVRVFTAGGRLALPISGNGEYQWQLKQESGTSQQGRISGEMTLVLPGKIPAGYHQLTLSRGEQQWHCRVIVAPKRCFEPEALLSGKSCGEPVLSCTPCVLRITGELVISAIYGNCCHRLPNVVVHL